MSRQGGFESLKPCRMESVNASQCKDRQFLERQLAFQEWLRFMESEHTNHRRRLR